MFFGDGDSSTESLYGEGGGKSSTFSNRGERRLQLREKSNITSVLKKKVVAMSIRPRSRREAERSSGEEDHTLGAQKGKRDEVTKGPFP